MNLRQQIIQDRVEQAAKNLGVSKDAAFLRLTHSIIVGQSIHAFDPGDLVDGGQDKQIDVITIEQDDDQATVYIRRTCSHDDTSHLFWFLNNGITIVCDSADPVTDPDNAHIKVKNLQIVNGCQTATTLALAERDGVLAQDVRVLLRIYETAKKPLVDKIVLTTNNQNKISSRDLRANDQVQIDMERGFQPYGLLYERKVRQFDSLPDVDSSKIVANETVAQSYLAIVLKTPSDARRRKYKVWGELYGRIFGGHAVAPYVLAVQIYRYTANWLRESPFSNDVDDVRRKIARNGAFHIARIASFFWRGNDHWKDVSEQVEKEIRDLGENSGRLDGHLRESVDFLQNLIIKTDAYSRDIDAALKSANLDADITSNLHKRRKKKAVTSRA